MNKYLVLIIITLFFSCKKTEKPVNYAKKGIITLNSAQINTKTGASLIGEWEFYENKLYTPDSFLINNIIPEYINYPEKGPNKKLNKHLYATYRLKAIVKNVNFPLVITNKRIFSSNKIWVNGKLLGQAGIVNTNSQNYKPELKITFGKILNINSKIDTIEIVIQIANFHDPASGIITPVKLENLKNATTKQALEVSFLIAIIAILSIIGLFSATIFIIRKKDYYYLALTALSILFITFSIATNDTLIKNIFISDFLILTRLTHISISLYPSVIIIFFYFMYKNEVSKKIVILALIISIALVIFSLFFNVEIIRKLTIIKVIFVFSTFSYLLFYALIKAILNKRNGAYWAFIGLFILSLTTLNDIFFSLNIINTGYISSYGFLGYFILQAMTIASNFAKTLKNNEVLSQKLEFHNKNLEQIVKSRTEQVYFQKEEILSRNEELQMQNEEILAQREDIKSINEKILHQSTKTNSSIRYAGKIQTAILPNHAQIQKELDFFILHKPKDKVSGDFYWYYSKKNLKEGTTETYTAIVDCTGHGVPAALMSMLGNMILNNLIIQQKYRSPAKILSEMHREIVAILKQEENKNDDGMDICICRIDKKEKLTTKITFSGAKSPLFYINSANKVTRVKGCPKPIGGIIDSEFDFFYTNIEIVPQKGDMIYLTSDGYIDQNNNERQRFGTVKFMKLLRIISNRPTIAQRQVLLRELIDFMEGEEQRDDISIWGIKI